MKEENDRLTGGNGRIGYNSQWLVGAATVPALPFSFFIFHFHFSFFIFHF
jgi:hypothetical protein